jgi:hypothetical protein
MDIGKILFNYNKRGIMLKPLKSKSYCDHILSSLIMGLTITPKLAASYWGCYCLSQRIGELKRRKHDIFSIKARGGKYHEYSQSPAMRKKSKQLEAKINKLYV